MIFLICQSSMLNVDAMTFNDIDNTIIINSKRVVQYLLGQKHFIVCYYLHIILIIDDDKQKKHLQAYIYSYG